MTGVGEVGTHCLHKIKMDFPIRCLLCHFSHLPKTFLTLVSIFHLKKKKKNCFVRYKHFHILGYLGHQLCPSLFCNLSCHSALICLWSLYRKGHNPPRITDFLSRKGDFPSLQLHLSSSFYGCLISTQIFQISQMVNFLEAFPDHHTPSQLDIMFFKSTQLFSNSTCWSL